MSYLQCAEVESQYWSVSSSTDICQTPISLRWKAYEVWRLLIDLPLKALSCHLCVLAITRCGEMCLLKDECCLYDIYVTWTPCLQLQVAWSLIAKPYGEMQVFEAVFTLGSIAWSWPEFDSTPAQAGLFSHCIIKVNITFVSSTYKVLSCILNNNCPLKVLHQKALM